MLPDSATPPFHSPFLLRLGTAIRRFALATFQPKAVRITAIYASLATLWIYFSDRALAVFFPDPDAMIVWSIYKGFVFVAFTSILLLLLMGRAFRLIEESFVSLREKTRRIRASEEQLATVIESAMDAIVTIDPSGRVSLFNAAAEKMFGWSGTEALGQPLSHFIPEPLDDGGESRLVISGRRKDGEIFPIEAAISRNKAGERRFLTAILRDVSLREAHEAEIERLNRLYSARSQINLAVVRTTTRAELFTRVTEVLVEFGKFQMAWIGWHFPEIQQIEPVAVAGDENGYLKTVEIHTNDRPGHRGPSGRAFREEKPYVCNDTFEDPAMEPWREEIERRGFRAAAFFPIRLGYVVQGILNVYADSRGFFQDKEIALLKEVAFDISFALGNLARSEERRETEAAFRSERLFSKAMIDSMPGILYFYNETGKFLRWNRNFEKVTGYSGEEISRMGALDFISDESKGPVGERIAEVFEKGESYIEAPIRSRNGDVVPYFLTGRRIEFDGIPCLVGIGIDISERKRMEVELRELNQTLELQVAERTAELQEALVRAEASDKMKSAFLATMSHELRTPLNSIIGFTGIVIQGLAGELNAEQCKQLGMVQSSARHLLELINDVLDLSKIEAGQLKVQPEPFSLSASIERVIGSIQPLADKKGLTLESVTVPELGEIVSDRRRVEQILLNLLNNAIKFTDEGSVTLMAERVPEYRSRPEGPSRPGVRICVSDTGIGIKAEDLAVLFQPFRQIDSGLTRQHEGTGLGLAICHRLATLLEGEISVVSISSKGSNFSLTIPLTLNLNRDDPDDTLD